MLIKDFYATELKNKTVEENRNIYIDRFLNSNWKKVLYIHIPFCPSKCKYCICETRVCNDDTVLADFVKNTIKKQIDDYKRALNNTLFDQLYIGGGTPTILNADLLRELFEMVPGIKNIPIKCIECSPNTLSFEQLDLIKEYEFSFISMGVQSMQRNVCKWQNRYFASKEEMITISNAMSERGLYFNYDLICYLGKGDIRDIPDFKKDLEFIAKECKPSSICIHQHHQSGFTTEKTRYLFNVMNEFLSDEDNDYECVNAMLSEDEIVMDTMYQAQYRMVRENRDFNHYMWKRYPMVPVRDYDVLGLGYIDKVKVKSNVQNLVFSESGNSFTEVEYQDFVYEDFRNVRIKKGLKI